MIGRHSRLYDYPSPEGEAFADRLSETLNGWDQETEEKRLRLIAIPDHDICTLLIAGGRATATSRKHGWLRSAAGPCSSRIRVSA